MAKCSTWNIRRLSVWYHWKTDAEATQPRRRELAVRSAVCIAVFLLLDRLPAPPTAREPLVLAAASARYVEVFQQIIHTSWLGPGLILAVFLLLFVLVTGPTDKPNKTRGLVRKFKAPKLERYGGKFPKNHRDLEI